MQTEMANKLCKRARLLACKRRGCPPSCARPARPVSAHEASAHEARRHARRGPSRLATTDWAGWAAWMLVTAVTLRPRSCVSKAQNSHLPEFGAARQPHGRPSALVPLGASATGAWAPPSSVRPQTRSGAHAACAAVLTRPRTVTCPSLARRGSRTAGRARLCRWAPARPSVGATQQCAAPNSFRLACGPRSCVSKAQNSHLPEFEAARQPHGRPSALVPLGASATGAWAPPRTCAAPNSFRLACGPCSCVNKA